MINGRPVGPPTTFKENFSSFACCICSM
jgi:hypothetical protein